MAIAAVASFLLAAPVAAQAADPNTGPGGPILVAHGGGADDFGRYYAEILRNEGLNEFDVANVASVTPGSLNDFDVVVLGETTLSPAQVTMFTNWVQGGGNLIAMRPDPQLAGLLGLTDTGTDLADAYLKVETSTPPGQGIVDETIQFHGTADRYSLSGATGVAELYSDANTATTNPAVTTRSVGANGGEAAAFTYDLARSVVYTRQGNPAWAGQERDGESGPIRPDDLFFPDWVDLDKVEIPQADEQQRLLANMIGRMNLDRKPLPRFWYLPHSEKAAIVMTGDDHGNGGTAGRYDLEDDESGGPCTPAEIADWECVRSTSYVYPNTTVTGDLGDAGDYEDAGWETALHATTFCGNYNASPVRRVPRPASSNDFATAFPDVDDPVTNRNHCIAWSGYTTTPEVELDHGIRFDTNYYYWPGSWVQNRPGMFTGSGMPMRFADTNGSMIDVYQGATQMTDESGQSFPFTSNALLDKAIGPEGYYGAFVANMHTDSAGHAGWQAIVDSAQARGVPIVSSRQMLEWIDGRNDSSFSGIEWNTDTLSFTVTAAPESNGLRAMIPTTSAAGSLDGITDADSNPVPYDVDTIKGVEYAFVEATDGDYHATYAPDTTAPAISGVSAVADGSGTATITWQTDEPSDSTVDYGTSPGSLGSQESEGALVTNHSVVITGLDPGTTYHFRVSSQDASGNSATEPDPPAAPATFSTPSASFTDTTASDFGAGTPTGVHLTGDPAEADVDPDAHSVILNPTVAEEFSGSGLPASFGFSGTWASEGGGPGGTATTSGGSLEVNGAYAGTGPLYGSGRTLEFVATFGNASFQHVGFGVDYNSQPNWAMFSTNNTTGQLFARTRFGGSTDTLIPGAFIGSSHRYRIEWGATDVKYYVDGTLVATHNVAFGATQLRPLVSDFNSSAPGLSVDWLRMTPYSASGTFTSQVFDAGDVAEWGALSWNADTPAGTTVGMSVRTGNTPTPDGTWTPFTPVASSGGDITGSSRYVQYQADLASGDAHTTPTLRDVTIDFSFNPVAVDDDETVAEDSGANTFDVLANDTDADGGTKQIVAVTQGAHGSVAITNGGADLTYTPAADYCGPDTFTYTVNGGSTADVDVDVDCADDNPTAVNDSRTVAEDSGATPMNVLPNDLNADGGPITINGTTNPAHGTINVTGGGSNITYQPASDYCGPDSFTYELNGGSTATVSVTVTCADDNPTAVNDSRTVNEDSGATAMNVLPNDLNADGGPITITGTTNPAHGTINVTGGGSNVTYQPAADYCNTNASPPGDGPDDTFTYTLNGGSTATVSVAVTCVDDNPTAVNDSRTVNEDSGATSMNVLPNDLNADGGPITIASASDPPHGTATVTGGGSNVTYAPDADYCNTDASGPGSGPDDTFTYTLNGGSTATVSVAVTCVPDGGDTTNPVIDIRDPYEAGRYSIFADPKPELHADYDCSDADSGIASCVGTVADGALFDRSTAGTKTFTVTATDNAGNTATKTVTYRVFTFRNLVMNDNPLAYYRLGDPKNSTRMAAVTGPDGEYKNGQEGVPFGISGDGDRARRFTGANGYGYANGITAPRSYTLSAFFRLDDLNPAMILQHGSAGAIWQSGSMIRFRPVDWAGLEIDSGAGSVTAGTWHHVAATYNWVPNPGNPQLGTGTARLYLDGVHVDSGTSDKATSGSSTFYVGYGDKAPWLRGVMDEVVYYPKALSQTHVREIWLADPPPDEDVPDDDGGSGGTDPAPDPTTPDPAPTTGDDSAPSDVGSGADGAEAAGLSVDQKAEVAGRNLTFTLTCGDADCAGTLSAKRGPTKIGAKDFEIAAGEREFVRMKLSKKHAKLLRRGGVVAVTISGTEEQKLPVRAENVRR